jgi:excisionase family DNA binding protein
MPSSRAPRYLSVSNVAVELGVSVKTVRRWIERQELHVYRLGRQLRISEEDLLAFTNARRRYGRESTTDLSCLHYYSV